MSELVNPSDFRIKMLALEQFPPAFCAFNPTISLIDGGRLLRMAYRVVLNEGQRRISSSVVDLEGAPIARSHRLISNTILAQGMMDWQGDPRLFKWRGIDWMHIHDKTRMYAGVFNDNAPVRYKPVALSGMTPQASERNWLFFDDGALKCIYSIHPHRILLCTEEPNALVARPLHVQADTPIPWSIEDYGPPHGGSCPILVGDVWYSFFQSWRYSSANPKQRIYHVGFYGFSAEEPHRIVCMTQKPLMSGFQFPSPYSISFHAMVVYPSGAVHRNGDWTVSLGIHDRRMAFAHISHAALLSHCEQLG